MSQRYPSYIEDGYTLSGYVAPKHGLHEGCRFKYRAMLTSERAKIYREIERKQETDPQAAQTLLASVVARQVIEWDIKDGKGVPVPLRLGNKPNTDGILRLAPLLFIELYGIAMGNLPSHEDPQAPFSERAETAEVDLETLLSGESREESQAKN